MQLRDFRTRAIGTFLRKMNNDLMKLNGFELSHEFHPCSRDSSGDKGQLCFLAKKKKRNVIGISPLTVCT